tara:strand:+ start:311 stop:709 length:399 start_codon:yes stop_codon:yes gene_type:complete
MQQLHLNSMKQTETPLNRLFFGALNRDLLQRGIRQTFKLRTGIAIDYQNPDDLYAIMRATFISNSGDHFNNVEAQVRDMNVRVIDTCLSQIQTGVSQYMSYAKEIDTIAQPMDRPVNTSTAGKKLPRNNIGI